MGMMINPAKRSGDHVLFESLQKAHRTILLTVTVKNTDRLNRPGSPVWNPGENAAPLLVILSVSVVFILTGNLIVGTAMMVLGVLVYLSLIRPWILRRVYRRAFNAAIQNIHSWENLWSKGGLVVALNHTTKARCVSPADNWRTFVNRHFPQPKITNDELYASFKNVDNDGTDLTVVPDLND
jgi:hypothetical protein